MCSQTCSSFAVFLRRFSRKHTRHDRSGPASRSGSKRSKPIWTMAWAQRLSRPIGIKLRAEFLGTSSLCRLAAHFVSRSDRRTASPLHLAESHRCRARRCGSRGWTVAATRRGTRSLRGCSGRRVSAIRPRSEWLEPRHVGADTAGTLAGLIFAEGATPRFREAVGACGATIDLGTVTGFHAL